MRSLVVATFLLVTLCLTLPPSVSAQDPPPPPPPTPEAAPPPPPPQARERAVAVPRAERARDAAERVIERQERVNRQPEPAREPPATAAREQSADRAGAVRREGVRDTTVRGVRTAEESSTAASNADQRGGQRPGAVRRPPSDGRGGTAGPRDRAVARTSPPRDRDRDYDRVYIYPDYWSYGRYYDPFYYGSVHLGYLAYSPWGWTPAFYGYPYGYSGGYYQYGYDIGRVRLKVKPRDAEVYVDGYFAGTVDDFDGMLQSLRLDSGGYRIEIRKPGFETLQFDVRVQPDRTITYRGEMRPATP